MKREEITIRREPREDGKVMLAAYNGRREPFFSALVDDAAPALRTFARRAAIVYCGPQTNVGDLKQATERILVALDVLEQQVLNPSEPLLTARIFRGARYGHPEHPLLAFDGSSFWSWDGTRYVETDEELLQSQLYEFLETAVRMVKEEKKWSTRSFGPNAANVRGILHALRAECHTRSVFPSWLHQAAGLPPAVEVLAAANGLFHLRPDAVHPLRPSTPLFYSPNALDYAYDPDAAEPVEWISFLDQLFPGDDESIQLLQEFFGYCLTADTRQQKALLIVGPKRSGKGTIARILTRVIGAANVCGPTLSGLSSNFGLWSLIGKLLAVISDARLSGRTDQAIVTERILAITGEDLITIDRKNQEPVHVRLPTRLMILTNELPRLMDASGALASRFLILLLTKSFYGEEDKGLEDRLIAELPGILRWAMVGRQRLQQRGHFQAPATSQDAVDEMDELSSPISAFVQEFCHVAANAEIIASELYEGWSVWCKQQGRDKPGTQQLFGRDLRAAVPTVGMTQRRTVGNKRIYLGINLTQEAKTVISMQRTATRGNPF